ncbi:MAG: S-layer homology domain-containing protein [Eubacteriales bacterium]|nr:S-layer homology domain-containing protein [Eubacteriales bacterium]
MIKKLVYLSIMFIIIFCTNVSAEDNSVLQKIKEKINIPDNYSIFSSATTDGAQKYWWRTPSDEKNGGEISITVDLNGNIVDYYHFKNDYVSKDEGAHFSVYNRSDSRHIAMKFVEKVCPELADKIEYNSKSLESDISKNLKTATISFYRVENKVPLYDNSMKFVIDLNTAQVIQYNLVWDYDSELSDKGNIESAPVALSNYIENVGIVLNYKLSIGNGNKKAFLVYSPTNENAVIDGQTGNVIIKDNNLEQNFINQYYNEPVGETFTEKELLSLAKLGKFISISDAQEKVRNIKELSLTNDYDLTYSKYEKTEDRYYIYLEFSHIPNTDFNAMNNEEKLMYLAGDNSYVRVKLDMQTGEVVSAKTYNKEAVLQSEPVDIELLKQNADAFLQNNMNTLYSSCVYHEEKSYINDEICKFVYICNVDGIPFDGNNITVEYDRNTGSMTAVECNWNYNVEFESNDNVIGASLASKVFFDRIPLQPAYIYVGNQLRYVYDLYPFYPKAINAKDGELINPDGTRYSIKNYNYYADIEGHYAQGMIMRLTNNYIVSSGYNDGFYPDANISQEDFLSWMVTALKGTTYESTEQLYKYLMMNDIISANEADPDSEILKEDAIVFFIRALGYDYIARATDIYKLPYVDTNIITPSKIGYIALAKGIGMVDGDENNKISPKTPLTRGDASCIIYKYLDR